MTLLVVDVQHVFADPASEWAAPRFAEILPNVEALVAAVDRDIVFTRFLPPPEPQGAWRGYYERWPFARQPPDAPMWSLVEPFAGRPTLDAATFGKWDDRLAASADGELVVAGVSTDCCVLSTVLPAADAGRHVRVVSDACAGASDETHGQALALMALYAPLVEVVTTEQVLA